MADYSFNTLNDEDFEILVNDLLSKVLEARVERFKKGRDGGIDGRLLTSEHNEIIIQSKHYLNSSYSSLKSDLKKEAKKVNILNPKRYILATSQGLNVNRKKEIAEIFTPYLSEIDILGCEELNDFLKDYPDVERSHYKLWLSSSNVLSHLLNSGIYTRSAHTIKSIRDKIKVYVKTGFHYKAKEALDLNNCIIISGNPGVGKSTLAQQLCNEYVCDGYHFVDITSCFKDAWNSLTEGTKQIFYFDDFLGSNFLRESMCNEYSNIVDFIEKIIGSEDKKLVITSRSLILNQAFSKSDVFTYANLESLNCILNVESHTSYDKAKIFYNHLYFNLNSSYMEAVKKNGFYKSVIDHQEYNPRLIEIITSEWRLRHVSPDNYQNFILACLADLDLLWKKPFLEELLDFDRVILNLLTVNIDPQLPSELEEQFNTYCYFHNLSNNDVQFEVSLANVCGSFVTKIIDGQSEKVGLSNPSIADFLIARIRKKPDFLTNLLLSVNSLEPLMDLNEMGFSQDTINITSHNILNILRNDYENHYDKYFHMIMFCLKNLNYSNESFRGLDLDYLLYLLIMDGIHVHPDETAEVCIEFIKNGSLQSVIGVLDLVHILMDDELDDEHQLLYCSSIINCLDVHGFSTIEQKKVFMEKAFEYWVSEHNIAFDLIPYYEYKELYNFEKIDEYIFEMLLLELSRYDFSLSFTAQEVINEINVDKVKDILIKEKDYIEEISMNQNHNHTYKSNIINFKGNIFFESDSEDYLVNDIFVSS